MDISDSAKQDRKVWVIRVIAILFAIVIVAANVLFIFTIAYSTLRKTMQEVSYNDIVNEQYGRVYDNLFEGSKSAILEIIIIILGGISAGVGLWGLSASSNRAWNLLGGISLLIIAIPAFIAIGISIFSQGINCNAAVANGGGRDNPCNSVCWCCAPEIYTANGFLDTGCPNRNATDGLSCNIQPCSQHSFNPSDPLFVPIALNAHNAYIVRLVSLFVIVIMEMAMAVLFFIAGAPPPSQWGRLLSQLDIASMIGSLIGSLIGDSNDPPKNHCKYVKGVWGGKHETDDTVPLFHKEKWTKKKFRKQN